MAAGEVIRMFESSPTLSLSDPPLIPDPSTSRPLEDDRRHPIVFAGLFGGVIVVTAAIVLVAAGRLATVVIVALLLALGAAMAFVALRPSDGPKGDGNPFPNERRAAQDAAPLPSRELIPNFAIR